MTDTALRSDGGSPFRFPRRTRASERGSLDRSAHRLAGGPDRARTDVPPRPVPWPLPPSVGMAESWMVAPSSTIPAVVVLPRITTAGPLGDAVDTAPPLSPVDAARPAPPAPPRHGRLGVVAATFAHLFGLAVLLAAPEIEPPGGGAETEIQEISLVFTEASLDTIAGATAAATPAADPPPADPLPLDEPAAAETPVAPPPEPAPTETAPAAEIAPLPEPIEAPALLATKQPAETTAPPPPAETTVPSPPAEPPPPAPLPVPSATAAAPRPTVRPDPRPAPAPRKAERRAAEKPRPATATAAPGNAARDAVSGARSAGEAPGTGAGAQVDWRAAVLAALARVKRYPDDARDRGLTGRAVVTFTVSRDGSVGGVALAASSGVPVLDAATLAMPRRAALPPMPPGGPDIRTFTAGVRYDLH